MPASPKWNRTAALRGGIERHHSDVEENGITHHCSVLSSAHFKAGRSCVCGEPLQGSEELCVRGGTSQGREELLCAQWGPVKHRSLGGDWGPVTHAHRPRWGPVTHSHRSQISSDTDRPQRGRVTDKNTVSPPLSGDKASAGAAQTGLRGDQSPGNHWRGSVDVPATNLPSCPCVCIVCEPSCPCVCIACDHHKLSLLPLCPSHTLPPARVYIECEKGSRSENSGLPPLTILVTTKEWIERE